MSCEVYDVIRYERRD